MARKNKKKIKNMIDETEDILEIDEDSDHPVHEKYTKEKKILK